MFFFLKYYLSVHVLKHLAWAVSDVMLGYGAQYLKTT